MKLSAQGKQLLLCKMQCIQLQLIFLTLGANLIQIRLNLTDRSLAFFFSLAKAIQFSRCFGQRTQLFLNLSKLVVNILAVG